LELFLLFAGSVLVNNFVLTRFLGICPFIGVSNMLETAFSMGIAVTFVLTLTSVASWLIQKYLLIQYGLEFLTTVSLILVIASLVQFIEMVIQKTSPTLHKALGIFLPLITTNCVILGLALLIDVRQYNLISSLIFGLGAGIGFTLAIVMMAGIREEFKFADIPNPLRGAPIILLTAGIMSLAFMGFTGLIPL